MHVPILGLETPGLSGHEGPRCEFLGGVVTDQAVSLDKDRVGVGIACAVIGIAFMALFDAMAKFLGEGYGVVQLVFFRNFFGLLFVLLLVARSGGFSR